MEQKYKLKSEAIPFFQEKLATACEVLDFWTEKNVSWMALEKVNECWVEYGKSMNLNFDAKTLGGWSSNNGDPICHFNFTAYINGISHDQFKEIENNHVRSLMDIFDRALWEWTKQLKSTYHETP